MRFFVAPEFGRQFWRLVRGIFGGTELAPNFGEEVTVGFLDLGDVAGWIAGVYVVLFSMPHAELFPTHPFASNS